MKRKRKSPGARSIIDIDRVARDLAELWERLPRGERADMDRSLSAAYPGGFNARDEANALIAMAVRNGPIEDLHAGKHSPLLDDPDLSRITDAEMKALMIHATRMLADLLRLRDREPELYRRWMQSYGIAFCKGWERERE